jgi:hypothetical protein
MWRHARVTLDITEELESSAKPIQMLDHLGGVQHLDLNDS